MNIGVIGPPARVSGSTKVLFNQCNNLAIRGHRVNVVLQKRGLDKVKSLYSGLLERCNLIELESVPFATEIVDRLTHRYRTMIAGAHLPVSSDVWYRNSGETFESKSAPEVQKVARTIDLDIGAMLLRSLRVSKLLAKRNCGSIICYATLMALPVMPMFFSSKVRKALYLLDMPISKSLVTEGRSSSSLFVRMVTKFEKWVIANSDALACANRLTANDWQEWYGVKPEFIPPGCTPLRKYPESRGEFALTVTYWNPDKRPSFFLDIAGQIRKSKMKLVMAGHWPSDSDLQRMRQEIKDRELGEKLVLLPDLTEGELRSYYRQARCFVAPPKAGGYFMGAIEAAEVGTPIVYPRGAGAWDMFTPELHGLVGDPSNVEEFSSVIQRFEDDRLVRTMGNCILNRAREMSWDVHCKRIEKLIS